MGVGEDSLRKEIEAGRGRGRLLVMFVPRPERTERRSQRLKPLFQPLRLQQGMPQPRVVERRMIGNLEPFRRRRRRKEYCVGIELKEERSKDLKEQLQQRLLLKEEQ